MNYSVGDCSTMTHEKVLESDKAPLGVTAIIRGLAISGSESVNQNTLIASFIQHNLMLEN